MSQPGGVRTSFVAARRLRTKRPSIKPLPQLPMARRGKKFFNGLGGFRERRWRNVVPLERSIDSGRRGNQRDANASFGFSLCRGADIPGRSTARKTRFTQWSTTRLAIAPAKSSIFATPIANELVESDGRAEFARDATS